MSPLLRSKVYQYKGIKINRTRANGKVKYYCTPQVSSRKFYTTLAAAKHAVDLWEKKQYRQDRVNFQ